ADTQDPHSFPTRRSSDLTGDRVVRGSGPDKPLLYLGRVDSQVKVLGHRVELAEIEAAVREASGLDRVLALGWPTTESGADGIARSEEHTSELQSRSDLVC